ncbi:F-box domain-containing protein [Seiridium cupressi]
MDDFAENSFCSLCGLLIEPHDGTPIDEGTRLPWNFEVRARVGYLNFHREVCADLRPDSHCSSPDADLEVQELGRGPRKYWCFPVHETCWSFLRCRVESQGQNIEPSRIARHLFAVFYNTPTTGARVLLPGHDYGGASLFQSPSSPPDNIITQIYNSKYYYLNHDPNDEFDFDFDFDQNETHISKDLAELSLFDSDDSEDVFRDLPSEIIMLILSRLPSGSIGSLRLASRSVAAAARPSLLTQSFWSSRFRGEHEMAFAFANRTSNLPPEPINWRRLYTMAKAMLRRPKTYPGFQNRYRIWRALDYILPALNLRLGNEANIATTPYHDNIMIPRGHQSPMASGELTYESTESVLRESGASIELDAGCRLFESHILDWTKVAGIDNVTLGVSLTSHGERAFLSGMRILSKSSAIPSRSVEVARAGFINLENEQLVDLNTRETLKAVKVRVTILGIVGLSLDLEGSNGTHPHELGDFGRAEAESGVAELQCGTKLSDIKFLFGLDVSIANIYKLHRADSAKAWKLVALQLYREDLEISNNPSHTKGGNGLAASEIWSPMIPTRLCPKWNSPEAFPPQSFNMCLHVDFGGPNGELIGSLSMVNIFMGESPRVFFGFSFVYDNGTERLFGQRSYRLRSAKTYPCITKSFTIAGNKGEVIEEFVTSYSRKDDVIQAISIRTSFKRSGVFRLFGAQTYEEKSRITRIKTMASTPGQNILGFFVKLKSPGAFIRDLVVDFSEPAHQSEFQSSPEAEVLLTTPPKHLDSAREISAYMGGFAFVSADLTGLRRIHISTGKEGFSRSHGHISGLQLEYADGKDPVLVGQWIKRCDTLELEPDDHLVEITTWHRIINRFSRVKFGPIVGIAFVTSKGFRMAQPQRGHFDDVVCLKYRENVYEELETIAWGYNYQWDHVRILCVPKPNKRSKRVIMAPIAREVPQWAVREKILTLEEKRDGSPDPVELVRVTFKPLSDEPSGISFMYRSGKLQTVGAEGERPYDQQLEDGERLIRMDVGILRANRQGSITFYTDKNRVLTFMHENQRVRAVNLVKAVEVHLLQSGIAFEPDERLKAMFQVPETAGDFVGLWAIPERRDGCLKYPMFGPIFEADADEGGIDH